MGDKLGAAELLALKELASEGKEGWGGHAAIWAIFIIILIFAVIWIVGFGRGRRGANFGDGEGDYDRGEGGERGYHHYKRRREETCDQIKAEFYDRKVVCQPELREEICETQKMAKLYDELYSEKIMNRIEKGECKLGDEIIRLWDKKEDRQYRKPAYMAECGLHCHEDEGRDRRGRRGRGEEGNAMEQFFDRVTSITFGPVESTTSTTTTTGE